MSLFILALGVLFIYSVRRDKLNSYGVATFVAVSVVSVFFPLMSQIVEVSSWRNITDSNMEYVMYVQLQYFTFLIVFAFTYILSGKKRGIRHSYSSALSRSESARCGVLSFAEFLIISLFLLGSVMYGLYVVSVGYQVLTSSTDLTLKYVNQNGFGSTLGLHFIVFGILLSEARSVSLYLRLLSRFGAVLLVFWCLFYISSRIYIAILLFGYFYVYADRLNLKVADVKFGYIVLALLFWVLFEVFSLYRGFESTGGGGADLLYLELRSYTESALGALVGGSDFTHPFITALELASTRESGEMLGANFIDGFISLLPSSLVGEKPLTFAQWFGETYYPAFYQSGGGTGSSMIGEVWLNFGAFLGPVLLGFLLARVCGYLRRNEHRMGDSSVVKASLPYFYFSVFFIERTGLIAMCKQALMIFIFLFILKMVYRMILQGVTSRV